MNRQYKDTSVGKVNFFYSTCWCKLIVNLLFKKKKIMKTGINDNHSSNYYPRKVLELLTYFFQPE